MASIWKRYVWGTNFLTIIPNFDYHQSQHAYVHVYNPFVPLYCIGSNESGKQLRKALRGQGVNSIIGLSNWSIAGNKSP